MSDLLSRFQTCQQRINKVLDYWLPVADLQPDRLHEAMRYAALSGGKRVRPLLVYLSGEALQVAPDRLDAPACAVELIHAYSLVHDDLPAMDDDDLRRGRPTCHRAFDEATAILAGDALQSLAFYVLSHGTVPDIPTTQRLKMLTALAQASGSLGMAGGQAIDIAAVGKMLTLAELENMHLHKTGALIRTSVQLGALCSSTLTEQQSQQLDHYARCIGLAFQIQDDILDVESSTEILGKSQGADQALNKPTYPSLLGVAESRRMAQTLINEAMHSLSNFGSSANPLRWLADYIITRKQ